MNVVIIVDVNVIVIVNVNTYVIIVVVLVVVVVVCLVCFPSYPGQAMFSFVHTLSNRRYSLR